MHDLPFFDNLITTNEYNTRFLFKTTDRLVNGSASSMPTPLIGDCELILTFFVDKGNRLKASIKPPVLQAPILCHLTPVLS